MYGTFQPEFMCKQGTAAICVYDTTFVFPYLVDECEDNVRFLCCIQVRIYQIYNREAKITTLILKTRPIRILRQI